MFRKSYLGGKTCSHILMMVCCMLIMLTAVVQADESTEKSKWRLDAMPGAVFPRSMRFMTDDYTQSMDPVPSRQGLEKLRCSASAEFSGSGLSLIRDKIYSQAGKDAVIYVVDLRKESHGFINGEIPVSSYEKRNWGNYDLSPAEVPQVETVLLQAIEGQEITFVPMGKTDTKILTACTVRVGLAESEEALAARLGLHYKRIPIVDQTAPTDENIDDFMAFYASLPPKAWLHFHCHAGHGRTTTFAVFYDILCNPDVALGDIVARQYALGGKYLFDVSGKDNWKTEEARKRAHQVCKFYEYVQANRSTNFIKSFSQWGKEAE